MTPIQLDIIRAFGSKELSFGCLLIDHKSEIEYIVTGTYTNILGREWVNCLFPKDYTITAFQISDSEIEILGHIPELFPDVARVAKEKGIRYGVYNSSKLHELYLLLADFTECEIPYNPTLPLIDQDEQLTLIPLLSLIK